jgi:hypothetical protein
MVVLGRNAGMVADREPPVEKIAFRRNPAGSERPKLSSCRRNGERHGVSVTCLETATTGFVEP